MTFLCESVVINKACVKVFLLPIVHLLVRGTAAEQRNTIRGERPMRARWNKPLLTLWFNGGHSTMSAVDTREAVLLIRVTGNSCEMSSDMRTGLSVGLPEESSCRRGKLLRRRTQRGDISLKRK